MPILPEGLHHDCRSRRWRRDRTYSTTGYMMRKHSARHLAPPPTGRYPCRLFQFNPSRNDYGFLRSFKEAPSKTQSPASVVWERSMVWAHSLRLRPSIQNKAWPHCRTRCGLGIRYLASDACQTWAPECRLFGSIAGKAIHNWGILNTSL